MPHDWIWIGAGLLASLLIFGAIQLLMRRRRSYRRQAAREQFPQLFDLLVQSLKGGADLPTALRVVADMGPTPGNQAFAACCDQIAAGRPIAEAVRPLDDGNSSFALDYLVTLLETSTDDDRTRQALNRLEHLNRHHALVSGEIDRRLGSTYTTSVAVFAMIPLIAGGLLIFSPWYRDNLDRHPAAQVLLLAAIALYAVGGLRLFSLWRRYKMVRRRWS